MTILSAVKHMHYSHHKDLRRGISVGKNQQGECTLCPGVWKQRRLESARTDIVRLDQASTLYSLARCPAVLALSKHSAETSTPEKITTERRCSAHAQRRLPRNRGDGGPPTGQGWKRLSLHTCPFHPF